MAGVKSLSDMRILKGIFLGDVLLSLIFVIAIMTFNYILKNFTLQNHKKF